MRCFAFVLFTAITQSATAQQPAGGIIIPVPNMAILISADTLAVDESQKSATYSGNVQIVQGDFRVHCTKAIVWYEPARPNLTATIAQIECQQ